MLEEHEGSTSADTENSPTLLLKHNFSQAELLHLYLDVWFEIFPCQSVCYSLVDVIESLLQNSGSHVLLFLVLV